ncbi:conserved hypothetical protein [Frankia canadensis]|uniref:Ferredoxin reductase n=1 Tax=Frankia canadensis TaxID=1836972 RepID=A0A2I2KJL3_9ACTN|nr:conserved hypothetical protein [Frankia canadensis]SOU53149.1 conserved hypothetical protein [Frankia canadensis]
MLLTDRGAESVLLPVDWDDLGVELRLGDRAVGFDPSARTVALASGGAVIADKVLLATGGRCVRLEVPGAGLPGVFHLRDLDDAVALRSALKTAGEVVVVGGGFIGLEVAASAQALGCSVTVVEAASVPASRSLGPTWGAFVAEQHLRRGVRIGIGVGVRAIRGGRGVTGVELDDGTTLPADVVVAGIGMAPRTELAADLGLHLAGSRHGVVVDRAARTSHPAVFAAGDVTVQPSWFGERLVRYESYQNAQEQAAVAAAAMLGAPLPARDVPWFWSDQFDMNIQLAGELGAADEVVLRGDRESSSFAAFHLRAGTVAGVFAIGRGRDVRAAMKLIAGRVAVDADELGDESVDLRQLARRTPTPLFR